LSAALPSGVRSAGLPPRVDRSLLDLDRDGGRRCQRAASRAQGARRRGDRLRDGAAQLMRATMLLLSALVLVGCTESDIDPMMRQEKFKPYWENNHYADGRAMRIPTAGTVPRERKLDALVPPPVTAALVQRGKERFEI